jgi:hypothetical protein
MEPIAVEQAWLAGNRAAWASMLRLCIRELGYEGRMLESLVIEREATVVALRGACKEHGDNDWTNDVHLADVVENHLRRHLDDKVSAYKKKDSHT